MLEQAILAAVLGVLCIIIIFGFVNTIIAKLRFENKGNQELRFPM